MIDSISLTVEDQDLAESIQDCKEGETKTLTFRVDSVSPGTLTGTVTSVEGYGDGEEEDEGVEYEDRAESPPAPIAKKMPRAIVTIGAMK